MTDQDGATRKLSDFRGNVVALTFIFTRARCPTSARGWTASFPSWPTASGRSAAGRACAAALGQLRPGARHARGVEGARAAARARRRRSGRSRSPRTPSSPRVARPLGLVYGPAGAGDMIHNLVIAVIDPDGRLVRLETGDAGAGRGTSSDLHQVRVLRFGNDSRQSGQEATQTAQGKIRWPSTVFRASMARRWRTTVSRYCLTMS